MRLHVCLEGQVAAVLDSSRSHTRLTYSEDWLNSNGAYPLSQSLPHRCACTVPCNRDCGASALPHVAIFLAMGRFESSLECRKVLGGVHGDPVGFTSETVEHRILA